MKLICHFMRETKPATCHLRHMDDLYDEQLEVQMTLEESAAASGAATAPAARDAADGVNSMLKRIAYLERQRAALLARIKAGEVDAASNLIAGQETLLTVRLATARRHLDHFRAQIQSKN